jgi:hypothetical protein
MADPFSYANDIAPIQQRFFGSVMGSRNLSTAQKNQMIGASIGNQIKFNESLMKLQDSQMANRARDMQFEEASMRLRKTKEDMDRQKDILREMPMLQKELEEIQNDPNEESKQRKLSVFGIRNAAKITNVPEIDQAYRAASYGVNRGSQPRPSITYGDLVMKGVPSSIIGLTDATDINSAVPSTVAATAIRYIADEKTKADQAEKNLALAKENKEKVDKIFGDAATIIQKADFTTSSDTFENVGTRVLPFVAPEKREELETLIKSRKSLVGSKDDKKKEQLRVVEDQLKNAVQGVVLGYNPVASFTNTPTASPTATSTKNLFTTPTVPPTK